MSCILNAGIALNRCLENIGGIKKVHISTFDDGASFTETAGEISAVVGGTNTYQSFAFKPQTASFTEEGVAAIEAGTSAVYTQTLTMIFHKLETTKRNTLKLVAAAGDLQIVIETRNGDFLLMGRENGANMTTTSAATGTAYADQNGYTVTMVATELDMATPFAAGVFEAYIA